MPYTARYQAEFPAAHQLKDYNGKCKQLHGHNYKVQLAVSRAELNKQGMVVDFGILNAFLAHILAPLDHSNLNDSVHPAHPTAELTARHIFDALEELVSSYDPLCRLVEVTVWENDRCAAGYRKV